MREIMTSADLIVQAWVAAQFSVRPTPARRGPENPDGGAPRYLHRRGHCGITTSAAMPINPDRPDGSEAPPGPRGDARAAREPDGARDVDGDPAPLDRSRRRDGPGRRRPGHRARRRRTGPGARRPTRMGNRAGRRGAARRSGGPGDQADRAGRPAPEGRQGARPAPPAGALRPCPAARGGRLRHALGGRCCRTCRWPRSSAWPARWRAPAGSAARPRGRAGRLAARPRRAAGHLDRPARRWRRCCSPCSLYGA